jgi:hypothetical protein
MPSAVRNRRSYCKVRLRGLYRLVREGVLRNISHDFNRRRFDKVET